MFSLYRVRRSSVPKLHEVMGGDQNKDLLLRNYMLEMCPCSTMDCQIRSD